MAKVTFNTKLCKGCGLCVKACPKQIISFSKNSNDNGYFYAEVIDMASCIGCASCAKMCPDVVIEVEK
ncbi:MAG: 4Fe-4S binding protein [Clostridia bacterium]